MLTILRRVLQRWQVHVFVVFGAFFVIRLRHDPGWFLLGSMVLLGIGFLLNLLVIVANGGAMPFAGTRDDMDPSDQGLYKPIDEGARLVVLSDWIPLGSRLISPGDVLLFIGAAAGILGRLGGLK
ncbi:MAG: DUF5317 domain-containing protein [Planctomycetota bacterium]|nr:DUF5317 family protein [Planctomycetaceae bacterium]MDQ3330400.1 DUF5317 domain-containing protein [Planctomycetota bacterium]